MHNSLFACIPPTIRHAFRQLLHSGGSSMDALSRLELQKQASLYSHHVSMTFSLLANMLLLCQVCLPVNFASIGTK